MFTAVIARLWMLSLCVQPFCDTGGIDVGKFIRFVAEHRPSVIVFEPIGQFDAEFAPGKIKCETQCMAKNFASLFFVRVPLVVGDGIPSVAKGLQSAFFFSRNGDTSDLS